MDCCPVLFLIDCGSVKVAALASMLETGGAHCRTMHLDEAEVHAFDDCQGVVISGGPRLFTGEPTLVERFAFIDELVVPVLGICLGHQAIALRHGAQVHLGPARREPEPVTISPCHELVAGLDRETVFGQDHCEGVSLPADFELLGSSRHYRVEIMAGLSQRRFGVQFHPEISGPPGQRLLDNFVRMVGSPPRTT